MLQSDSDYYTTLLNANCCFMSYRVLGTMLSHPRNPRSVPEQLRSTVLMPCGSDSEWLAWTRSELGSEP